MHRALLRWCADGGSALQRAGRVEVCAQLRRLHALECNQRAGAVTVRLRPLCAVLLLLRHEQEMYIQDMSLNATCVLKM